VSLSLFAIAAILIAFGAIYFSFFAPVDVSPRKCPDCGAKTRVQDTFLMCDTCEMMVGVSMEAIRKENRARSRIT
jgi:hypothetical protein